MWRFSMASLAPVMSSTPAATHLSIYLVRELVVKKAVSSLILMT